MFSLVSQRMATGNSTEVETPKNSLSESGLTDPVINPAEPPKKVARFELSGDSINTWEINSDLREYGNKPISAFVSNKTLIEIVLSANPISSSIKGDFLLDPYLTELLSE